MILFLSDGRLGNQIFQYTFLNTIRKKKEHVYAINMSKLKNVFSINNPFFHFIHLPNLFYLILKKLLFPYFLYPLCHLRLFSFVYQLRKKGVALPQFKKKKGILPITIVRTDFFQSEHFFNPARIDFSFHHEILQKAHHFLKQTAHQGEFAFVHVRRSDYLNETYEGIRGINLPISFFHKAIQLLQKEEPNLFFIFLSDDPEFVECCFSQVSPKIISYNSAEVDLAIMSLCSYGVVSNSSFSWWGAYLMQNRKMVIFPKYWYGWKVKKQSHEGIYPNWAIVLEP